MTKKINKIIQEIFIEKKIDKLQKVEKEIKNFLGKDFIKKHTKNIFLERKKVVVEVRTIEAKTELNIIKKNFNTQLKLS